jgi:hypothetical protein
VCVQEAATFRAFMGWVRSNDMFQVERALRQGFPLVNMRDDVHGDPPLAVAVAMGRPDLARLLLQGGG